MFSFSMMVAVVFIVAAVTFIVFHYTQQARIRRAFIFDVYRIAKSENLEAGGAFSQKTDLDEFARDLFKYGVHVLACGGGVVPEPRSAIRSLNYKYGKDGLLWGAYLIYVGEKDVLKKPLLEGTGSVVFGILYYLGNQELLQKLISVYRKEVNAGDPSVTDPKDYHLGSSETLVAGICDRMGRPLPVGIRPLSPEDKCRLFN